MGIVLASEGYPENPITGRVLGGADPSGADDGGPRLCFHAATRAGPGGYVSAGGRVATFVGIGDEVGVARDAAYAALSDAELEGGQHRSDIGEPAR